MDVEKLLAAIEETERNAEAMKSMRWVFSQARMSGRTVMKEYFARNDPAAVFRRCRLDRDTVQDYQRALGRPECSPGAGDVLFALRMVVTRLAAAYGISVEEETTGE